MQTTNQPTTKPVIGQILICQLDKTRQSEPEPEPIEVTVTKVGRRYFTTADANTTYQAERHWNISDWRRKGDSFRQGTIYLSLQALQDEREHARLHHRIRQIFDRWSPNPEIPVETLRQIDALLPATLDRPTR